MSESLIYTLDSAGSRKPASPSNPIPVGPGPSGPLHNRFFTTRTGLPNFTWPESQNILRVNISARVRGYPGDPRDFFSIFVINPPTTAIGGSWLGGTTSLTGDYMPLTFYPGKDLEIITRDPITSLYMNAVLDGGFDIARTDIAATASGITSTTSNLNLNVPGRSILISGFATATNNGWFTLKGASATSMTFEEPMTAEAAGAAVAVDSGNLEIYIEAQEG